MLGLRAMASMAERLGHLENTRRYGDAAAAATTALAVVEGEGAVFEHTFTCVGSHAVSLSLSRSPSSPPQFAPAAVFTGEAMCKYVRRELRYRVGVACISSGRDIDLEWA